MVAEQLHIHRSTTEIAYYRRWRGRAADGMSRILVSYVVCSAAVGAGLGVYRTDVQIIGDPDKGLTAALTDLWGWSLTVVVL